MKRILLATVALAALCAPAKAADLPVKAAPLPAAYNPNLIWYVGLGAEASTEQANVTGNNLFVTSLIGQNGSLQASGGAITAAVGFISNGPRGWSRCQATAAYQNIAGANGAIGSVASRWSATQECDVGFEWLARVTALLPKIINIDVFPTPGLPSNVIVVGAPKQYVGVLAKESQLSGQFFGASGSVWDWAPGFGTGYLWQTSDVAGGKPNGGLVDAYLNVSFPQRGFTATFPGGGPGAPVFSGGAKLGTQYTVGLRYDLPVM